MNRFMLGLGAVGVCGLSLIAGYLNAKFSFEAGGWSLAAGSICLDSIKAAFLVAFVIVCTARGRSIILRLIAGTCFAAIWCLVTAVSFQSAGSTVLRNRMDHTSGRFNIIETRKKLGAEREHLLSQNPWTPQIEQYRSLTSTAISAQIAAYTTAWQWNASDHCEKAAAGSLLRYCQGLHVLAVARQVAADQEKSALRIGEIEKRLEVLPAFGESDPYAKAVADITNIDQRWVVYFWAGLFALLLEVVPNIGPALLILVYKMLGDEGQKSPAAVPGQAAGQAAGQAVPGQAAGQAAGQAVPGHQLVLAATRQLGSGEFSLDAIIGAVCKIAAREDISPPSKAAVGRLLISQGHEYRGRRRMPHGRVSIYFLREPSRDDGKASSACRPSDRTIH